MPIYKCTTCHRSEHVGIAEEDHLPDPETFACFVCWAKQEKKNEPGEATRSDNQVVNPSSNSNDSRGRYVRRNILPDPFDSGRDDSGKET